ncbi:MAG: D-alanyl-D-alanine carboxypeptidase [Desulfovibrio sp.]|nr:D-alanyl-D-alanine carboxypeptidase [Desulfovibrio sp.]
MRTVFLFLACILLFIPAPSYSENTDLIQETQEHPLLDVASAILFDLNTNTILYEQNADTPIQPASLTKIMSIYLALDTIAAGNARFDSPVIVSQKAANEGGSRMGIRAGEEIRLGELLLGMAVSSGNDASLAVAEFIGGTNESFIHAMNEKARKLGMTNTHFGTPNGLPVKGQYTTARDMLTLARNYLRRYPWALSMHNTRFLKHQEYVSWNRNPLLAQYPGADGLKTGWVRASGFNMIFTAERNYHRLLAVILGAPDAMRRAVEACRMLDAGFLVCLQKSPSVAVALTTLPFDSYKVDLHKSAHEAVERFGYVSSGFRKKRAIRNHMQAQVQQKRSGRQKMTKRRSVKRR